MGMDRYSRQLFNQKASDITTGLGEPSNAEGSSGSISIRDINGQMKLFAKYGSTWHGTDLGTTLTVGDTHLKHITLGAEGLNIKDGDTDIASFQEDITLTSGTITLFSSSHDKVTLSSAGIVFRAGNSDVMSLDSGNIDMTGKINITSAGTRNVCIGVWSSGNPDLAEDCIAIGVDAGKSFSAATKDNVAIGSYALEDTVHSGGPGVDGSYNLAIGFKAGLNVTSGSGNILLGLGAGGSATTNSEGTDITTGTGNICIGNHSGVDDNNSTRRIVIGRASQATGNYGICIGDDISTAEEVLTIGRSSDYITVDFGENASWSHSSDQRIKKDITDNALGLAFINDLRTVNFKKLSASEHPASFNTYDKDIKVRKNPDLVHYGFIAQEVKAAIDKAGHSNFPAWSQGSDGMQFLAETEFITPLVKAVQELSAKIDTMQTEINSLKG